LKHATIKELREYRQTPAYRLLVELIEEEDRALVNRLRYADTVEEVRKVQGALGALESIKDAMQIPK
jgi:ubiquinone biosynthesis protein UbiJ